MKISRRGFFLRRHSAAHELENFLRREFFCVVHGKNAASFHAKYTWQIKFFLKFLAGKRRGV